MMKNIIFFGECMLEDHSDGIFRYGGDTLNSAIYLARVCKQTDLRINYATALGVDHDSELLLAHWEKEHINSDYVVQLIDRVPGRYAIKTNDSGERSFSYQRDNSAARVYFQFLPEKLNNALTNGSVQYFYFSGISLAILSEKDRSYLFELLSQFKASGGKIIFDNNFRPSLWGQEEILPSYRQAMKLADIAFLTDEDEYALYPQCQSISDIIKHAQQFDIEEIIVKQGSNPCVVAFQQTIEHIAAQTLDGKNIIDTCAAGDSFSAGYLAKRLLGSTPIASAQFAHQVAARVIQFSGAIIPKHAMSDLLA